MSGVYLMVKVGSLAMEARIIRRYEAHERRRAKTGNTGAALLRESLYLHRVNVVRPEARAALLAAAFLRGQEYAVVERPDSTRPDYSKVWHNVKKFGHPAMEATAKQVLEKWFNLPDGAIR